MKDTQTKPMHISMQYFADKGDGNTDDNGGNKEADGQQKNPDSKTFTEEEVNALIEKRLARERKKAEKEKAVADSEKDKTPEEKAKETSDKQAKEQSEKLTAMSQKLICYDNDVPKANVNKVIKLANTYVDDDVDFEKAISKVKEDFSFLFSKDDEEEKPNKPSKTGVHSKGNNNQTDGVEASFYARNPDLKP